MKKAIILAAGLGSRLRPLTNTVPKSLIPIFNHESTIERQIRFFLESGIRDIFIVVGYLKHLFEPLVDRFGVRLIENKEYMSCNNIQSMYLVRELWPDAYVVDADNYWRFNFVDPDLSTSTMFSVVKKFEHEWLIHAQSNACPIEKIEPNVSGFGPIVSGISYFSSTDGYILKNRIENMVTRQDWHSLYWDEVVKDAVEGSQISLYLRILPDNYICEIDSLADVLALKLILESQ